MDNETDRETKSFWDRVAVDWDIQVGEEGDSNRILNSDPVLWKFAGEVAGLTVLDAGCGTGYLSRKLAARGATVVGVDFSGEMIAVARAKAAHLDFRIDSCSTLKSVDDESIDLIVSNYVLMDLPDLAGATMSFARVLKPGGIAVLVFSHPCFPQGSYQAAEGGGGVYQWPQSYFEEWKQVDPPWGHFTSEFIWFHRPLSDYWKAFVRAGFEVVDFDEPRIAESRYHLAGSERKLENSKNRPYSVAFKLRKKRWGAGTTLDSRE